MTSSSTSVAHDAYGYELLMGRWSKRLALPFIEFVGTGKAEHVLDVGCGTGHLGLAVAAASGDCRANGQKALAMPQKKSPRARAQGSREEV